MFIGNETLEKTLNYIKKLEKENDHFRNADLTSVYLKGVYDGKEQATVDNSICKEKMAEDALQENVKLKKQLADSTPNSVIREKINERQFELQQEYKDFKDDIVLKTLQDIYYKGEKKI